MKSVRLALFLILSLLALGIPALAQQQYILPQVANGTFAGGSFRITFVVNNNSDQPASVSIRLTDDNGSALPVTVPGLGTNSQFVLSLPAGATRFLQTDGSGPLTTGAATVTSTAPIGVSAIFTVYDSSGKYLTEAGVGSSTPTTGFVIPVDTSGNFNTGVALFNAGLDNATLTLSLVNLSGQQTSSATLTLNSGRHLARFVGGQLFPAAANFRGTLVVTSSSPIAAVTLRQNSSPLSYTSLPAVARTAGKTQIFSPQVADGATGGIIFRTSFPIFNMSQSAANVVVTLTRSGGSPFIVTIAGRGTSSVFNVNLPAGGSVFLETDGSGDIETGSAVIASDVPIGASAIFTVLDGQQRFLTEAGVGDSPTMNEFTVPVDITGNSETGVAFFNPNSSSVTMTFRLLEESGALNGSAQQPREYELLPGHHIALFVGQMFQFTQDGRATTRGSLAVVTTGGGIAAVGLRQNNPPLTYTTLPVTAGVTHTVAPAAKALLSKTRTGTSATADVVLNETLASGFRLSGTISGAALAFSVAAQASDGTVFSGGVNPQTGRYLVVVPAGTYNLQVCNSPTDSGGSLIISTYRDPTPVQVSADTTRNITLPALAVFAVTGTLSGLQTLPTSADATLVLTSSDNLNQGTLTLGAGGAFQGQLPNGAYTASLLVPTIQHTATQRESMTIYNLGSVTIAGASVTRNFSVPAVARLSGTVRVTGLSPLPASTFVGAVDTSGPSATTFVGCVFPPTGSTVTVDPAGPYQLLMATGRTYSLSLILLVLQGSTQVGTAFYPTSAAVNQSLPADTTYNFNVPGLPGFVTLSGRVTDSEGQAVSNGAVTAFSQQLSGAPDLGYSASALTDSNGNYRMTLLAGTAYTVSFFPTPPQP